MMKLRTKVMLLIFGVFLLTFGICGFFSVYQFQEYSLQILTDSETEKMEVMANALKQVGTREDLEQMGTAAQNAYLKYEFQRCCQKGYALLRDNLCMVNLTDYEVINPAAMTGEHRVQKLILTESGQEKSGQTGGREVYLLLTKQALEYPAGFEVLSVKDISSMWKLLKRQICLMAGMCIFLMIAAGIIIAVMLRRMLKGLEELQRAAGEIMDGKLGAQVAVRTKDEVGEVGMVFNSMSRQIEEQMENLQFLMAAMAHEMKTPLTSIMGYADSLLHVRLPEERRLRALKNIYQSGKRMELMSAKLLNLIGMYENGAIEEIPVLLSQLFDTVEQDVHEILAEKEIRLVIQCTQDAEVTGDRELLTSLVSNLVINSCRASENGSTIWLSGSKCQITVRDQGCGIAEKDLKYVTKAFFMADKSRSRSEGGSGLGLALSERIAKLHHADLLFDSREGEGTTVTVRFSENIYRDFTS